MNAATSLGKYQILGELGKGGFATVYRARDPDLGRDVALKVLDPLLTRDPVWVARFRREARAVASLDHPRVVTVHEIGQAEGSLYIAMKLMEGGSLKQRIEAQGPLPWDEVVRLAGQIAEALDFAHGQGVLHRDLKPANVLLDPRLGAVLTDFGFASLVADNSLSISMSGGVVGTPAYIAPEVWEGDDPSPRTDLYALGCIVYELATGQMLFTGNSTPAVMRAHFQPRRLPETWPEGTPQGLTDVLLTALAQEPASRYATASEMSNALAGLREDTLAAPYADLQDAVEGGRWQEALALTGQVRAIDASYRDVVALEGVALAGLERAARVQQAAEWRAEAERALADEDFKGAGLAVQKWQELTPDDGEIIEFRVRLTHAMRIEQPAPAPQEEVESEVQEHLPVAMPPPTSASPADGSPPADWTGDRPRRIWPGLALGAVAILALILLVSRALPENEPGGTSASPSVAQVTDTSTPVNATIPGTVTATLAPGTVLSPTSVPTETQELNTIPTLPVTVPTLPDPFVDDTFGVLLVQATNSSDEQALMDLLRGELGANLARNGLVVGDDVELSVWRAGLQEYSAEVLDLLHGRLAVVTHLSSGGDQNLALQFGFPAYSEPNISLEATVNAMEEPFPVKDFAEASSELAARIAVIINYVLGEDATNSGDYDECTQRFSAILNAASDIDASVTRVEASHVALGRCLDALGLTEEARAQYEAAIVINPDYAAAYYGLGNYWYVKRDFGNAREQYERSLSLSAIDPLASEIAAGRPSGGLGNIALVESRHEDAVTAFTQAIAKDPEQPGYYLGRATAFRELGNTQASLDDLYACVDLAQHAETTQSDYSKQVQQDCERALDELATPSAAAKDIAINLRAGPSTAHPIVGSLQPGETVTIIGRDMIGSWLEVQKGSGTRGWVYATLVSMNRGMTEITVATVIPTPPPTPTSTPSPLLIPSPTPTANLAIPSLPPPEPTATRELPPTVPPAPTPTVELPPTIPVTATPPSSTITPAP